MADASSERSEYASAHDTPLDAYSPQIRWISGAYELEIGQSLVMKKRTFAVPEGCSGFSSRPSTSWVLKDASSGTSSNTGNSNEASMHEYTSRGAVENVENCKADGSTVS